MNSQIDELIQSFEPDSKNSKKIYKKIIKKNSENDI